MRFVDSNVFLHAFLVPHRELTEEERRVKEEAKAIVRSLEEGEEVATTAVHLSEVINIIETGLGLQRSSGFLAWVLTTETIKVYPVSAEDYENAMPLAKEASIGANDALAYLCMKNHEIREIYSFDRHYDQFKDITRVTRSSL